MVEDLAPSSHSRQVGLPDLLGVSDAVLGDATLVPPLYDGVLFCGDNLASLNLALGLKGNGVEGAVARELAWRSARYRWSYAVAHLPAEGNKVADRMSRILDPSLPKLLELPSALIGAAEVSVCVESLWSFP